MQLPCFADPASWRQKTWPVPAVAATVRTGDLEAARAALAGLTRALPLSGYLGYPRAADASWCRRRAG
jgi:hypothetical protein